MADKEITIRTKVLGADQAAGEFEKMEESIFGVQDAAQQAQQEMDLLEAKRRSDSRGDGKTGGILGTDISGAAQKLGQEAADYAGFGQQFRAVSRLISADAVSVAGSFAGIGAAAVKSYEVLDETAARWREFEAELQARGDALPQEIADQIAAIEATIAPVKAVIDGVTGAMSGLWKMVKDPVGELTGLNDLKTSLVQQEELLKKLNEARLKMANESGASLAAVYKKEADGLKQQEETLQRIGALRGQLESIEQQRANRQIKIAQQDGGDVALAEANALAVRLKTEVNKLSENLRQSQAAANAAQQNYDAAFSAYNRALTDNLDKLKPDDFAKLSSTLDKANEELQKSQSIANEQATLFAEAKANVAEDVEVALIDLKDKYQGEISQKAATAFNGITESLKETLATGPQAAIANIQVEVGTITTAATGKAAEVQQGLSTERAGTVQAIQNLAPKPQDTQAITNAVQQVGKAIADQGNATIAALGTVAAGIGQISNAIARQQNQINQLFARIR